MNAEIDLVKDINKAVGDADSLTQVLDFAFRRQGIQFINGAVNEFLRIACKYREGVIDRRVAPEWVGDGRVNDVEKILSSIEKLRGDVGLLIENIRDDFYVNPRSERFLAACASSNSFESIIGEDEGSRNFRSDVFGRLDSWKEFFLKSVVDEFGFETGNEFFREDALLLFCSFAL